VQWKRSETCRVVHLYALTWPGQTEMSTLCILQKWQSVPSHREKQQTADLHCTCLSHAVLNFKHISDVCISINLVESTRPPRQKCREVGRPPSGGAPCHGTIGTMVNPPLHTQNYLRTDIPWHSSQDTVTVLNEMWAMTREKDIETKSSWRFSFSFSII